ncbi:helix-turn-helix domain-containing protein [Streptomyces sp. NPDC056682]|uniref:helix-turn-helix domain-containing protein n=1 Tax=Streptomyces sp. NPDC056682 TaxID=3345909 RepID=UPI003688B8BB
MPTDHPRTRGVDSAAGGFGCRLRGARERAGNPSYRRMATACGTGYATLAKAAAGERMPTWPVTEAFLTALGRLSGVTEDLDGWLAAWQQAMRREQSESVGILRRRRARHARADTPTMVHRSADPASAASAADYLCQLRVLKAWSGLSLEQISKRTRNSSTPLATSTISDTLRRDTLPKRSFIAPFVTACGGRRSDVILWENTWSSIKTNEILAAAPDPAAGLRNVEQEMNLPTDRAVATVQEAVHHLNRARHRTPIPRQPRQPGQEPWLDDCISATDQSVRRTGETRWYTVPLTAYTPIRGLNGDN